MTQQPYWWNPTTSNGGGNKQQADFGKEVLAAHVGNEIARVQNPILPEPDYDAGYWEDPTRVKRWYDTINSSQALPDWMDASYAEAIKSAYGYFKSQFGDKADYEWGLLQESDPGREYLQAIPIPPADFLMSGEERFLPEIATTEQPTQPQGSFEYYGLSKEQWEQLSTGQQIITRLFGSAPASGAVSGALGSMPEGFLIGAASGGLPGGIMGAGAAALTGGTLGAGLGGLAGKMPKLAEWLQVLDGLAELVERSAGTISFIGLTPLGLIEKMTTGKTSLPYDLVGMIKNLDDVWAASHLAYDVAPIGETSTWAPGMAADQARVVDPDEEGYAALVEAYTRINEGESVESVYQDIQTRMGLSGQLRDTFGHMLADPLNFMGAFLVKGGLKAVKMLPAMAQMQDVLRMVENTANGPVDAIKQYGVGLRTMVPPTQLSQMDAVSRWLGGVDKAGNVKALDVTPPGKFNKLGGALAVSAPAAVLGFGIGGPVGAAVGAITGGWYGRKLGLSYLTNLTPAARATEVTQNSALRLAEVMNRARQAGGGPEQMIAYAKAIGNTPQQLAADLSMRALDAPEAAAMPLAWRDFGTTADGLLAGWKATADQRVMLENIGSVLGKSVDEVLTELGNSKDANVLVARYVDAAKKANAPEAASIIQAFDNGDLTGDSMKGMVKSFVDDGVPYNEDLFAGQLYGAMLEHAANWSAKWFGVKPDPAFIRLGQTVKSAQSLVLLGINPSYLINNAINNTVTMATSGVFSLRGQGEIDSFWGRIGYTPPRLRQGITPSEMPGKLQGAGDPLTAIMDAQKTGGALDKITDATGKVADKLGVFSILSGKLEGWSSAQAWTGATKKVLAQIWRPGVGFDRMPQTLERMLGPEMSDLVYSAVKGGLNQKEIEAKLWAGTSRRSIDSIIPEAAAALGKNEAEIKDALDHAGMYDFLSDRLQNAETNDDVHKAFTELNDRVADYLDDEQRKALVDYAEKAKAKTQGEGMQAALELFDRMEVDFAQTRILDFEEWGDTLEVADTLGAGQRRALIERQVRTENARWRRFYRNQQATALGIAQALGVEGQNAAAYTERLGKISQTWADFYHDKWLKRKEYFDKLDSLKTAGERRMAWDTLQAEIRELYKKHSGIETQLQGEIDIIFERLFTEQFGPEAGAAARQWRQEVLAIRSDFVNDMDSFQASLDSRKLKAAQRRAEWAKHKQDVINPLILEKMTTAIEGAHWMYKIAKGDIPPGTPRPGSTPQQAPTPKGPAPKAPKGAVDLSAAPEAPAVSAPAPVVLNPVEQAAFDDPAAYAREMFAGRRTRDDLRGAPGLQARVDRELAIIESEHQRRVMAEAALTRQRAEVASSDPIKAAEARRIAQEFGIESADEQGNILPGSDKHILNAIKKNALAEGEFINDELIAQNWNSLGQIDDLDVVRRAFERRKRQQDAFIATQEAAKAESRIEKPQYIYVPRSQLATELAWAPPEYVKMVDDAIVKEAHQMFGDLSTARGGRKYDVKNDITLASENPNWYRQLYAQYKVSRKTVLNALQRIIDGNDIESANENTIGRVRAALVDELEVGGHPAITILKYEKIPDLLAAGRIEDAIAVVGKWTELADTMNARLNDAAWTKLVGDSDIAAQLITRYYQSLSGEDLPLESLLDPALVNQVADVMRREEIQAQVDQWQQTVSGEVPGVDARTIRMTRDALKEQALKAPGVTEQEVDAWLAILDAEAGYWSQATGLPKAEYYSRNFAGVVLGEDAQLYGREWLAQLQNDPNAPKGAIEFIEDGRALIHMLEASDISTLVHESGHLFRRHLNTDDARMVEDWAGVVEGAWTRDAEEKFAIAFEQYVREGNAPTEGLNRVFAQFKEWLARVYSRMKGNPLVKLDDNMRTLFDRMLTETGLDDEGQIRTLYQRKNAGQMNMFGAGEDLPLFSGAAQRGQESIFNPQEQSRQGTLFDMTPQMEGAAPGAEALFGGQTPSVPVEKIGNFIYFKHPANGELYRAPADAILDVAGIPSGSRWEAPAHMAEQRLAMMREDKPKLLFQQPIETTTGPARLITDDQGNSFYRAGDEVKALSWQENISDDPNILYQSEPAAVNLPLGTIDGQDPTPPTRQMMQEAWDNDYGPLLREIEGRMSGPDAQYKTMQGAAVTDPAAARELVAYLHKVYGQQSDAKQAAIKFGEQRRDHALLNYQKKYGFDNLAQTIFPYQFWYTRSAIEWAMRAIDRPAMLANYARMRKLQAQNQTEQQGFPTRLTGKIKIPIPYLPEWAGGGVYFDPWHQLFPIETIMRPIQDLYDQRSQEERRAEYTILDMLANEEITEQQARTAISEKGGDLWEKATTQARLELDQNISNPFDFAATMFGPSLPVGIAYNAYKGQQDKIGLTPATRFIQSISAPFVPGGVTGPEGWLRKQFGLPERGAMWDYYTDRMLANMAAEGRDVDEILLAMNERSGPLFEEATQRVGNMEAGRYFSSFLWADLFPEGEQEQRALQPEFAAAADAGDLGAFFDAHPEYRARMEQNNWGDPEARLRTFLRSQIWNGWNELGGLQKDAAEEQLGEDFQRMFLNKETRSYDSIDTETLAMWVQQLGGEAPANAPGVPGGLPGLELPSQETQATYQGYLDQRDQMFPNITKLQDAYFKLSGPAQEQFARSVPMLAQYWEWRDQWIAQNPDMIEYMIRDDAEVAGAAPEVQRAVYAYKGEKATRFPGIGLIESQYFDLSKVEQKAYMLDHPELEQYWDWQKVMLAKNPQIIPYIKSDMTIAKGVLGKSYEEAAYEVDTSKFSQPLVANLFGYAYGGQSLGSGTLSELQRLWRAEGQPFGNFDIWLQAVMRSFYVQ